MNILWRYGYSIKRLQEFINSMLDKFERLNKLALLKTTFFFKKTVLFLEFMNYRPRV